MQQYARIESNKSPAIWIVFAYAFDFENVAG